MTKKRELEIAEEEIDRELIRRCVKDEIQEYWDLFEEMQRFLIFGEGTHYNCEKLAGDSPCTCGYDTMMEKVRESHQDLQQRRK
tara:strand:- start:16 stop:267 length:252 start_codon:yes stop_codon:yes gene_type:complete